MNHLSKSTQLIASLDDEKRIEKILSEKWIGYTRARNILLRMEELLSHPKSHRMPNMLLVGPTNNGKRYYLINFLKPINQSLRHQILIYLFRSFIYKCLLNLMKDG